MLDAGGGACRPAPPNVNQRQKKRREKSLLFVLRSSFQLWSQEASRSQQGLVGCVRSPGGGGAPPVTWTVKESKKKPSFFRLYWSSRVSTAQSLPGVGDGGLLSRGVRVTARTNDNRRRKQVSGSLRKNGMAVCALYK